MSTLCWISVQFITIHQLSALDGILSTLHKRMNPVSSVDHHHDKRATFHDAFRGNPEQNDFFDDQWMHPGFPFQGGPPEDEDWGNHGGPGFGGPVYGGPPGMMHGRISANSETTASTFVPNNFDVYNYSKEFAEQYKWATFSFLNGMDRYSYSSHNKPMVRRNT